eukprot:10131342-Alexandrium_andersonii.AAC.1
MEGNEAENLGISLRVRWQHHIIADPDFRGFFATLPETERHMEALGPGEEYKMRISRGQRPARSCAAR